MRVRPSHIRAERLVVLVVLVVIAYLVLRRHVLTGGEVVFFAVLFASIIVHEVTHGVVALALGDDTALRAGRLTLNPLRHVDIFGTIILPAVMVLTGVGAFGYAKPVPVNVAKLRRPRDYGLLVALAGPAVNVLLALGAALAIRALTLPYQAITPSSPWWLVVLVDLGFANVLLAAFNLIPIPPLDGSAVIERVLPAGWWPRYLQLRRYSLWLVFALVLLVPGALDHVFVPAFNLWGHILGRPVAAQL